MNKKMNTAKLAKLALLAAISCVLMLLIRIPFPPAPFLVYDPADIPIYITTFAFGPVSGLIVTVVAAMLVPVIIPFNLLKGGINALVTFLIYKRISPFLHRGM